MSKAELSAQGYITTFQETDPVFTASVAHGISASDISNWNDKLSQADLSAQAYAGYSYVYAAYSYILDTIVDNELVIAVALTDLDERITIITDTYVSTEALAQQAYITQAQLSENSYLTQHQSLANYVTKAMLSAQAYLMTETDPVFTASAAHGISSSDISNWNDKVSKAELSAQGYITTFQETDPMFVASAAYSITFDNIENWDAKVSKTELSSQSYLQSFTETDPVFVASAAYGITSSNITSWNNKVSANNSTITIQKNSSTVDTFTTNQSSAKTINIPVNELPTVTSSDNGKVLMVVNGAWAVVDPIRIYGGSEEPSNQNGNNGDIYLQS